MQAKWAKRAQDLIESKREPNFTNLTEFVEQSARVSNNMYGQNVARFAKIDYKQSTHSFKPKPNTGFKPISSVTTLTTEGQEADGFFHRLDDCSEFAKKPYKERLNLVRRKRLCDNCLKPSHMAYACRFEAKCKKQDCGRKHNTLLHSPETINQAKDKGDEDHAVSKKTPVSVIGAGKKPDNSVKDNFDKGTCNSMVTARKVCLRVVPVKVHGPTEQIETWALLDNGSDVTLCDRRLVDRLRLKGVEKRFLLTTLNKENNVNNGIEVDMTVQSLDGEESVHLPRVWTVNKLPVSNCSIPAQEDVSMWTHLQGLKFPNIDNDEVMLLIGSDVPEVFWALEERRGDKKEPYAIKSLQGWTLLGPTVGRKRNNNSFVVNNTCGTDDTLQRQVERFWELDYKVNEAEVAESVEDKLARSIMDKSVTVCDGHFQIGLPWHASEPCLPNNRRLAEVRLRHIKRRLERDPSLSEMYKDTIEGYTKRDMLKRLGRLRNEYGPCNNCSFRDVPPYFAAQSKTTLTLPGF